MSLGNIKFSALLSCLCLSLVSACGSSGTDPVAAGGSGGSGGQSGVCSSGDTRECVGPAACKGGQVCGADKVWSGCDCGGGVDAGQDSAQDKDSGADTKVPDATVDSGADVEAGYPEWNDSFCQNYYGGYVINGDTDCKTYKPKGICSASIVYEAIPPVKMKDFLEMDNFCVAVRTPSHPGEGGNCGSHCSPNQAVASLTIPIDIGDYAGLGWGICVIASLGSGETSAAQMGSWRVTWEKTEYGTWPDCKTEGQPRTSSRFFIDSYQPTIHIETDNPNAPARHFTLCRTTKEKCL